MKKMIVASAVTMLATLALAGCGSNQASASDTQLKADNSSLQKEVTALKAQIQAQNGDSTSTETTAANKNKTKSLTAVMGKEYVFKDNQGKKLAGMTLKSVDQNWNAFAQDYINDPDYLDDFALGAPENMVQVVMEFTNYGVSDEDDFSVDNSALSVYDDTGKKCEANLDQDGDDTVSLGHTGTATMWYKLAKPYKDTHKIELEFDGYLGEQDAKAKWVVEK